MESKWHRVLLAGLLLAGTAFFATCSEDNPEECYSNSDCPNTSNPRAKICITTVYNSGIPSGGYCVECLADPDCDDQAFPTCNTLFNTCECHSSSGVCGTPEGGVPEGGVPEGGMPEGGAQPDDGGAEDSATNPADDAGN